MNPNPTSNRLCLLLSDVKGHCNILQGGLVDEHVENTVRRVHSLY